MISRRGWLIATTAFVVVLLIAISVLGVREIRPTQASVAATLTVNTTADNGSIDSFLTLQEAIRLTTGANDLLSYTADECAQISNSSFAGTCTTSDGLGAGFRETIQFDPGVFPSGAPATIAVGSALPVNTDPVGVTIDGSGAGVIIDGGGLAGGEDGLVFASGAGNDLQDVTVRSLTVQNFPGHGVVVCGGDAANCADGLSDAHIDDVTASGNGGFGIRVTGQTNDSAQVVDSLAVDNAADGVNVNAKGDISNATVSGTEAHDNGSDGIEVNAGDNNIGTTVTGNMATGNGSRGLQLNAGDDVIDPIVTGNTFTGNDTVGANINAGTDHMVTGALVTGNTFSNNGSHGLRIGSGALASPANLIAENEAVENVEDGIHISRGSGNTISRNSTTDNGELGIDLRDDADVAPGVTLNDVGDVDEGTNDLLNYPEVDTTDGQAIMGSACDGCTVELFRSDGDPSGHGEGEVFLSDLPAGGGGSADGGAFSLSVCGLSIDAAQELTLTATDPAGSTSEFSPNFTLGVATGTCPTPTPVPTATPPAEGNAIWGDDDCDGDVDAVDALKDLQEIAAIPYLQTDPCFDLGDTFDVTPAGATERIWGDVDCDGDVDAVDALAILRDIAAFSVNQQQPCPEIGADVLVS